MLASEALSEIGLMLDDVGLTHVTPEALLRHLSRAHLYVAARYALLRETQPLSLLPQTALYPLLPLFPTIIRVIAARLVGIGPLWPVDLRLLGFQDAQWLATPSDPTHPPQWHYTYGLSLIGIYPVPSVAMSAELTAALAPRPLTSPAQALVVPEAYVPRVIDTGAGFAMLSSEKQYAQGLVHVRQGLGFPEPTTRRRRATADVS